MKIENLAMIFVIIIIPIALVLSVFTQYQIQTINMQTLYDNKLTSATYDAMRAYQINANNSTTSELSNSKTRDIEASVSTFKNSIVSSFELNGYTSDELDSYIPALVYTMYDGFYIYSPYQNIANADGTITSTGQKEYGLKPYISYSCRYKSGNIDVVITYALDNHGAVQGRINGEYVNKDGYLIDGISCSSSTSAATSTIYYNGVEIGTEQLKEYLPMTSTSDAYPYVKINGTKYYKINNEIVYISNGAVVTQCKSGDETYAAYERIINNNYMAKEYYFDAYTFTNWFKTSGLSDLRYSDAYDEVLIKNGETASTEYKKVWENNNTRIFQFRDSSGVNIENETSQFNQHRLEIIRHKIETNLAIAISNYNSYSNVSNVFQMPELKDDEWDQIVHNIALISFLQGIPIGGKVYNGYTLVTNSESEEVVLEESIYMLGSDNNYHKIGDKDLESGGSVSLDSGRYGADYSSSGRLNLSFTRKYIMNSNATYYYYPLRDYNASYNSVVMQNKVTTYDDIYSYISNQGYEYKKAFYTALGREREGKFIASRTNFTYSDAVKTPEVQVTNITLKYISNGENVSGMPMDVSISSDASEYQKYIRLNSRPTKANSEFLGWSLTKYGEVDYSVGSTIYLNKSLTLYAVWAQKSYTIYYNVNAGWRDNVEFDQVTQTKKYGETIKLTTNVPKRDGYTFTGWAKSSVGSVEYLPGANFSENPSQETIILYAVWVSNEIKITYNANGKQFSDGTTEFSETKYYGGSYTIASPKTSGSAMFKYWSTDSFDWSGAKRYYPGDTYYGNDEITLYAIWNTSVEVTGYRSAGSASAPHQYNGGTGYMQYIISEDVMTVPTKLQIQCAAGNGSAVSNSTISFRVEGLNASTNQWESLWEKSAFRRAGEVSQHVDLGQTVYSINPTGKTYKKFRILMKSTDNERYIYCSFRIN